MHKISLMDGADKPRTDCTNRENLFWVKSLQKGQREEMIKSGREGEEDKEKKTRARTWFRWGWKRAAEGIERN